MDRDGGFDGVAMESVGVDGMPDGGGDSWRRGDSCRKVENEDGLGGRGVEVWILVLNLGWMGAQLIGLCATELLCSVCLLATAVSGDRDAAHLAWPAAASVESPPPAVGRRGPSRSAWPLGT